MITVRKVGYADKYSNARQLRKDGFVSSRAMHSTKDVKKLRLPSADVLKKKAKESDELKCICCNMVGVKSYWYLLEDLRKLYGVSNES